jgi:hypothetical protein
MAIHGGVAAEASGEVRVCTFIPLIRRFRIVGDQLKFSSHF